MNREQLEHVLRAAAAITGADRFYVIGSQAILGQFPTAPGELRTSIDVDIYTSRSPEDAELIDGTIGEMSPFHTTFGYYAHGVGQETATLPAGWKDRLIEVVSPATHGAVGLCLEVHDLAISKLVAGREKDLDFVRAMVKHALVDEQTIRSRLRATKIDSQTLQRCIGVFDRE